MNELGIKDDDYVVRVKAQVMTRDESTGGWVPLGRGGMSLVGLRRIIASTGDDSSLEYILCGQRIADNSEVLCCALEKDLQYTKANPTFHHWWTGDQRFGLTFQSSAEARVLERSIRRAVENMLTPPDCTTLDSQITDDDVFMALNLPLRGREEPWSRSESTSSSVAGSLSPLSPSTIPPGVTTSNSQPGSNSTDPFVTCDKTRSDIFYFLRYSHGLSPPKDSRPIDLSTKVRLPKTTDYPSDDIEMMDYTYVQLAKTNSASPTAALHEYTYPSIEVVTRGAAQLPKELLSPPHRYASATRANADLPPLPSSASSNHTLPFPQTSITTKSRTNRRDWSGRRSSPSNQRLVGTKLRCMYCQEVYTHDENVAGACIDAPDRVGACIECVSCVCCARGLLYHCASNDDDSAANVEVESVHGGNTSSTCHRRINGQNCRRWTMLAFLALFVPCLFCYLPLHACHKCGMQHGCCGGKHKSAADAKHA